jgi:hypothetical protein
MSAYTASARIGRVRPHVIAGAATIATDRWAPIATTDDDARSPETALIVDPDVSDSLADRLAAARDRWSQLTFFLFDPESRP